MTVALTFSSYLGNGILNHVFAFDTTGTELARPTALYLALHLEDPGEDGTGEELSSSVYSRQPISFEVATNKTTANSAPILWDGLPTVDISHLAVWDALTDGNLYFIGALAETEVFVTGDDLYFATGDIEIAVGVVEAEA